MNWPLAARLRPQIIAGLPGVIAVGLMLVWAAHNGGYDADTWYWGALVLLGVLVVLLGTDSGAIARIPTGLKLALLAFGLYVGWSYLSILWAGYPGDALTGSNRALMYWLVFAVFALAPWSEQRALWLLVAYVVGLGVIGLLILKLMANGGHVGTLFEEGRLVSPTGYLNSDAALFTIGAFLGVALAERRELPVVLRGLLIAIACGSLQLALLGESRGWLFTLPFTLLAALLVARNRLRVVAIAGIPIAATLLALHPLLGVFRAANADHPSATAIKHAAEHAGRISLLTCAAALLVGTLVAAADTGIRIPALPARGRMVIGTVASALAIGIAATGALAATHGHPIPFIKRQWHGFTHPATPSQGGSGSHFATVGSGRYDIWRVALDATLQNPIGGLGQDNFGDFYNRHRGTSEEIQWTHSFELRLLAHTGVVGALLFGVFLAASLVAALRSRSAARGLAAALSGAALLPLCVWLVHGSVDWFWEMPALSGPALGFLALAGRLGPPAPESRAEGREPSVIRRATVLASRIPRPAAAAAAALGVLAAALVLGLPYLAVRDLSSASDLRASNPVAALSLLSRAANLNSLDADAPRLAGLIALQSGRLVEAERRFTDARKRQPGGWFAWFGEGLAASALGDAGRARSAFSTAARINNRQPAVTNALARVDTTHPLTPNQALGMLVLAH
ncbi:MAG: hypothetical protein JOZ73_07170 [Solirubrobacterales bacterium]|nr:hypothetical protein [Solirubrobacterales bacterium]